MSSSSGFVIRDALETDVQHCLALEAHYTTDYVWQVNIQQDASLRSAAFKTERLPRTMHVVYAVDERRLNLALADHQCFLVAAARDEPDLLFGYLAMRADPIHQIGWIHDLVVAEPFRRRRIGTRLLKVARQWALENDLRQIMIETQTRNHPAILFCQQMGFVFCGFNDRYFTNQDIAVFFAQSLR